LTEKQHSTRLVFLCLINVFNSQAFYRANNKKSYPQNKLANDFKNNKAIKFLRKRN